MNAVRAPSSSRPPSGARWPRSWPSSSSPRRRTSSSRTLWPRPPAGQVTKGTLPAAQVHRSKKQPRARDLVSREQHLEEQHSGGGARNEHRQQQATSSYLGDMRCEQARNNKKKRAFAAISVLYPLGFGTAGRLRRRSGHEDLGGGFISAEPTNAKSFVKPPIPGTRHRTRVERWRGARGNGARSLSSNAFL